MATQICFLSLFNFCQLWSLCQHKPECCVLRFKLSCFPNMCIQFGCNQHHQWFQFPVGGLRQIYCLFPLFSWKERSVNETQYSTSTAQLMSHWMSEDTWEFVVKNIVMEAQTALWSHNQSVLCETAALSLLLTWSQLQSSGGLVVGDWSSSSLWSHVGFWRLSWTSWDVVPVYGFEDYQDDHDGD